MSLTIGGVLFIACVFGGSLYVMLTSLTKWKDRLFYSVVFGLLFVSPIGVAVEKWGEQNRVHLEKEIQQIPIDKKDTDTFSRVITEQKGVHLYLFDKDKEDYYFVPKENIREVLTTEKGSYLAVYKRYDAKKHSYLLPFVKNDEYFIFYKEREEQA